MADKTDLENLQRGEVDLSGCDFSDSDLSYLDLRGRNFHSANFQNADLRGSDLTDCNLTQAKLFSVKAKEAVFDNCRMTAAIISSDFTGASFRKADFQSANLQHTDFTNADFGSANFQHAMIDDHCSFTGALVDQVTTFALVTISRSGARQPIFQGYDYRDGRLVRNTIEILSTSNTIKQTAITASYVVTRLNSQPSEIADMALALAKLVEDERIRLDATKPNDPTSLEVWHNQQDFLSKIAYGLERLDASIRHSLEITASPTEKFSEPASIIADLRETFAKWLRENSKELADSASRLALIGVGTGFLGLCGAPVAGAFAISAALLGGPKVGGIISETLKSSK